MTPSFTRRSGYAVVPNATVHDRRLSVDALGLLVYLLALPPAAPTGYRDLQQQLSIGAARARRMLGELTAAGYRHTIRRQLPGGRWTSYVVNSDTSCSVDEAAEAVDNRPVAGRGKSALGATSANDASVQVAPSAGEPKPGSPAHVPTGPTTPTGNSTRARHRPPSTDDAPTPAPGPVGALCGHGWTSPAATCPHCPGGRLAHLDSPETAQR